MLSSQKANISIDQHNKEIFQNHQIWQSKPILQKIYDDLYRTILKQIASNIDGCIVELGSGIGSIKNVIPQCICTDIFQNPWIDQVENVYSLSFRDNEVSNIVLFDVFHHLQYPGSALEEMLRVLCKKGRVIILEPCLSVLGWFVYGMLHHEQVGFFKDIEWNAGNEFMPGNEDYYAAMGNAMRVFDTDKFSQELNEWKILLCQKKSCISYIASGGFSKPQMYPTKCYSSMQFIEKICNRFPRFFATRMLIILEKQ
jgi:SAM-dependent methyltransferase